MKVFTKFAFCLVALLSIGVRPLLAQRERLPMEDLEIVEKRWPNAKRTFTGLRYIILEAGDAKGESPVSGNVIKALYKGSLLNGKVFDENHDRDHPLAVRLGRGNLIRGWEEAMQRMHRGEKWLLIVPSELGYGAAGRPPEIPHDATLVFEIELLDFSKD
jgi:FKBP-type peptidyl-prolyl cis-trans isomerase